MTSSGLGGVTLSFLTTFSETLPSVFSMAASRNSLPNFSASKVRTVANSLISVLGAAYMRLLTASSRPTSQVGASRRPDRASRSSQV